MHHTELSKILPLVLSGKKVGGVALEGKAELRVMMTGQNLQLVALSLGAGYYHPRHNHPDHESIGYVITGKLSMMIGDKEYVMTPGSTWCHPKGVYHWTRAIEDCEAVEIHSPPRPEFL
jgi:quercetin dioxygenase-like cupin family protein